MFSIIRKSRMAFFIALLIDAIIVAGYFIIFKYFSETFPFIKNELTFIIVVALVAFIPLGFSANSLVVIEHKIQKNYISTNNTLAADVNEAYNFAQLGLLVYSEDHEIIWCSDLFIERKINVITRNINDLFPELHVLFEKNASRDATVLVSLDGRIYSVLHIAELSLLIFKDVSDIKHLETTRDNEQLVIGTILLDNLASLQMIGGENNYSGIQANVNKVILDYCRKNQILIRKIKDDTYNIFMNEETFQKIKLNDFSLVDEVLECSKDSDVDLTISVGFGRGARDYIKLFELSTEAINVAQSRGGCQTVVANFAGHLEFYGSSNETKYASSLIQNRTFAQSFYAILSSYKQIFIIPHFDADFDAIGAALGVYTMAQSLEKEVYIVCEEKQIEMKARMMFKDYFSNEYLISPNKASSLLNDDTLVVIVDVHRQVLTTAPKLIEDAKHLALIDHHRRAEDMIDNTKFSYMDPLASSASELVANMIVNIPGKIVIPQNVATYMMAGILLDTRGFKTRTSASTFKAAMDLKTYGADTKVADSYMKDELETFELKTKTLSTVEIPLFGIGVAIVPENQIVTRAILATMAEQLNNVKGLKASFVIGFVDRKTVGISARSDGTVNVQLIMERLGGGGHHSEGASQIAEKTVLEVKDMLITDLKEHRDEID